MIVHAAESLYWFNTTEPPYLKKGLPTSLESRHTTPRAVDNALKTLFRVWSGYNVGAIIGHANAAAYA